MAGTTVIRLNTKYAPPSLFEMSCAISSRANLPLLICLLTQYGITHAFVFEFANVDDWRYYIDEEPAHWDIAKSIKDVLEKVQTVDFADGVFSGRLRE